MQMQTIKRKILSVHTYVQMYLHTWSGPLTFRPLFSLMFSASIIIFLYFM
jgi:hypothetical protein